MSLTELRRGQSATITTIPDAHLRTQLLRFGITTGSAILCHTNIPFGPIVLRYGGQEIALGREIAKQITIE